MAKPPARTDEYGLPVRFNWAAEYRGRAAVVYGHTPTPVAEWINNTICLDTGCVFGGKLTALRYPERELVAVPAARIYMEPVRPLGQVTGPSGQQAADAMLDIEDVQGKRTIVTKRLGSVRIEPENAAAALEIMSRFAMDPRWLIYLPPTMSPPETSSRLHLLEHPDEAFGYYARAGIGKVIIEEKHMGSRAVIVLARDPATAQRRFGVEDGKAGVIYTRTGRAFFSDDALERALIERISAAAEAAGLWTRLANRLAVSGCRTHALVGQGARLDRQPVPSGGRSRNGRNRRCRRTGGAGRGARRDPGRSAGPPDRTLRQCRSL